MAWDNMRRFIKGHAMPRFRWKKYLLIAFSIVVSILLVRPTPAIVAEAYISPLSPPKTTSPRITLSEFRDNMELTYALIMSAYNSGHDTPGLRYSSTQNQQAEEAEEALTRAIKTLDLSEIPPAQLEDIGVESALLLNEILDRIPIPADEKIPDFATVEQEKIDYWEIPGTEIAILKVSNGFNVGDFIFSKETVKRLKSFYYEVKHLPYRENSAEGFYEFYISNPGGLLPPKWSRFIPDWSKTLWFEQTIWQWGAMIFLYLLVFWIISITQKLLKVELERTDDTVDAWLSLSLPLVTFLSAFMVDHLLDQEINITGTVLGIVKTGNLILEYAAGAWFAFLLLNAIGVSLLLAPRFRENVLEATMVRNGFRLLGILAGATVVTIGFTNIGISVAPLLASLGAGSLALSFGLQPYIQDTIGGITLFLNGAMEIGDFCEFGGIAGTIEDIGLRATLIRTRDRRLITMPNSNVSSMLVNHSRRDKFLFDHQLELAGQTSFMRIPEITAALCDRFSNYHRLEDIQVNVTSLSQEGTICLSIRGYVLTTNYTEFTKIQADLMLEAVAVLEELDITGKISAAGDTDHEV
jgi:MscS family membrane protein